MQTLCLVLGFCFLQRIEKMQYEVSQMQGKVFSTVSLVRAIAMLSLYQLEYWGCTHCQRMVNSILAVELMLSSVGGTAILWIKSRNRPMKWSADRNQGPLLVQKAQQLHYPKIGGRILCRSCDPPHRGLGYHLGRSWCTEASRIMSWARSPSDLWDPDSFVSPLPLSQFPLQ